MHDLRISFSRAGETARKIAGRQDDQANAGVGLTRGNFPICNIDMTQGDRHA